MRGERIADPAIPRGREWLRPRRDINGLIRGVALTSMALSLILAPAHSLFAEDETATLIKGWEYAARLQINDSHDIFKSIRPSDARTRRMVDLGLATTLLNVQPKTSGNIAEAEKLLQEIIQSNPSDETAVTGKYLLGRIAQIHMSPPDEALAIRRYSELIESHPNHPLAQSALVKRAMLNIFSMASPDSLQARYESALQDSTRVTEASARRDYMLLLAQAASSLKLSPEILLDHLLKAEAAGNFRDRSLADLYVRIGGVARDAGQNELAITYYDKFLNRFTRDNRRYLVKEMIEALRAGKVSS